jgi:hypothetical protein
VKPNMLKTSGVCNIVFVILTCFHLTNLFGEEKFSWLPSKNKVAEHFNLTRKFASAT